MDIELLNTDGSVYTRVTQVQDPQKEFDEVYQPMYGVASWREYQEPAPTAEELKARAIAVLDAEYQPQFRELQLAWAAASMAGDTALAADIAADNAALKVEYQAKLEAIDHG